MVLNFINKPIFNVFFLEPRINYDQGFLPDFPRFSCGEYEVFTVCAPVCPDDCTNYKEERLCKNICVPACKCIDGYVKGKDGKCIKIQECEESEFSYLIHTNSSYKTNIFNVVVLV